MASKAQVAELRDLTSVTIDDYNNDVLNEMIDSLDGSVNAAAASIWRRKAASYSSLVDVSESGSSRSMSQLFKQAKEMAMYFQGLADAETAEVAIPTVSGRTRVKAIERA